MNLGIAGWLNWERGLIVGQAGPLWLGCGEGIADVGEVVAYHGPAVAIANMTPSVVLTCSRGVNRVQEIMERH